MIEEVVIIPQRISGQDIGNPNAPSVISIPHEGHRADAEAWTRTKNHRYLKKMARQRINKGSEDKGLYAIIQPRHHD